MPLFGNSDRSKMRRARKQVRVDWLPLAHALRPDEEPCLRETVLFVPLDGSPPEPGSIWLTSARIFLKIDGRRTTTLPIPITAVKAVMVSVNDDSQYELHVDLSDDDDVTVFTFRPTPDGVGRVMAGELFQQIHNAARRAQ